MSRNNPVQRSNPFGQQYSLKDFVTNKYAQNVQGLSDIMTQYSDWVSGRSPSLSQVNQNNLKYIKEHPEELPSLQHMVNRVVNKSIDFMAPVGIIKSVLKKSPWEITSKEYNKVLPKKPTESMYIPVGGKKIEVVQNPTSADFSAMKKEAFREYGPPGKDPALRFTEDSFGNKYYWKAYDAIHPNIEPELSKRLGVEVNQNAGNKMSHRGLVRRALYEGKFVPKSVLDEYPGLVDEVKSIEGNLLMDESSRMARAKEMGYTDDAYHYSRKADDIKEFSMSKWDLSPFSIGPHVGTKGAAHDRFYQTSGSYEGRARGSTYPLKVKTGKKFTKDGKPWNEIELSEYLRGLQVAKFGEDFNNYKEANEWLADKIWSKYDSIPYINNVEGKGSISYMVKPENVRSRFAEFKNKNSKDILAGMAGIGLTGAMLKDQYE